MEILRINFFKNSLKNAARKVLAFIYAKVDRDLKRETPLFLFGSWRGGTTLLQRVLNSVDNVFIWGEQGSFLKCVAEAYYATCENSPENENLRANEGNFFWGARHLKNPAHWSAWTNWYGKLKYQNNFRKFIKSFFCPIDRRCSWGFKEIRYGRGDRVMQFLAEIYPGSKFAFIVRHPVETIRSQLAASKPCGDSEAKRSSIDKKINSWNAQNHAYLDFARQNPSRSFLVGYEALRDDNYKTLGRLFDFLGFRLKKKQTRIFALKQGRGETRPEEKVNALTQEEAAYIEKGTEGIREALNKYLISGFCY